MEEATHQIHRPRRRRQDNNIYMVLGFILILPMLWQEFGNDRVAKWHPFFDVEYSLYWYIALTVYNVKPFLYLMVAILSRPRHFRLLMVFAGYELVLFIDHILIYSQSPGISIGGVAMAIYIVWYHWKYEYFGWIG